MTPSFESFGSELQALISASWDRAVREGIVSDAGGDETPLFLREVFGSLAHELGRLDAVARLNGVGRDSMLDLLRDAYSAGKAAALQVHYEDSKGCRCEASAALERELEAH